MAQVGLFKVIDGQNEVITLTLLYFVDWSKINDSLSFAGITEDDCVLNFIAFIEDSVLNAAADLHFHLFKAHL